jgi:hypothetical protein
VHKLKTRWKADDGTLFGRIVEYTVLPTSSKGKPNVKSKLTGRRSEHVARSGALGNDDLFKILGPSGSKMALSI